MKDRDLLVKVLKAGETLRLPKATKKKATKVHVDQAAEWPISQAVRIHAVSIPEQSEVSIYADIEVSTAPKMYMPSGHIFRSKYAGPAIQKEQPSVFFAGFQHHYDKYYISKWDINSVPAGETVFVHLDLVNHSPYDIEPMTQDVYIYYSLQIQEEET